MLSELHKLFKLIWQKKKCCDCKSWKYFFHSAVLSLRQTFLLPTISFYLVSVHSLSPSLFLSVCLTVCLSRALSLVRVRGVNIPGEQRALSLGGGLNHCSEGPMILPVPWDTHCIPPSYSITHTYTYSNTYFLHSWKWIRIHSLSYI